MLSAEQLACLTAVINDTETQLHKTIVYNKTLLPTLRTIFADPEHGLGTLIYRLAEYSSLSGHSDRVSFSEESLFSRRDVDWKSVDLSSTSRADVFQRDARYIHDCLRIITDIRARLLTV